MNIQTINISMKNDLQELIDSTVYISKYSGYTEIRTAEEDILDPELPANGIKENARLECVYDETNEMVNYCQYYKGYENNNTLFLGGFYIKRNKQKNGLGKKILEMYEEKWKQEGYTRIILQVDIKNWVGIRFWFRNGYNKIIKWIGDLEYLDNTYAMIRLEKII
jgi:GNAT superfamily N-acetyltransferase